MTPTGSLLELDVAFTDIVFQGYESGLDGRRARRRSTLDYAIEGVARPAAAQDQGDGASDLFLVYVCGYADADRMDRDEDFDQRSVCYIASDRRSKCARRTNIYIERFVFRRLVELYASGRSTPRGCRSC